MRARGHRQRKQRPAVEGAVERDDRLPPGMQARQLDGVLDRLRSGVEERAPRTTGDRRERAEPFGDLDVQLVGDDGEVGVEKAVGLVVDRLHDPRVAMAHVEHAYASHEVDERVPVEIRDGRTSRLGRDDGGVNEQRLGHRPLLSFHDPSGARARNLGPQLDHPGRGHAPERIRHVVRIRLRSGESAFGVHALGVPEQVALGSGKPRRVDLRTHLVDTVLRGEAEVLHPREQEGIAAAKRLSEALERTRDGRTGAGTGVREPELAGAEEGRIGHCVHGVEVG